MKNSLKNKLVAGFSLCVLLMMIIVGINYIALEKMEIFYQKAAKRSTDMILATDAQHIGQDLDIVITDAALCGDITKIERDWAARKAANLAVLQKMRAAADTPEEYAGMREAEAAFNKIILLFEEEMLPLIKQGRLSREGFDQMHHRLDQQLAVIDQALGKNLESMANENHVAERDYHAIMVGTTKAGLAISLLGVFAALTISVVTTRRISRPLAEITNAAVDITRGTYPESLKYQADDEIGTLTDAFRAMSEEVKNRTLELQMSNVRLQQEINERAQAEKEIFRLNADLEERVMERTALLLSANEQLQKVIADQQEAEKVIRSSKEELRNLTSHLQCVREKERTRISREIHDELGQALTALKMDVSWLAKKLRKDQPLLHEKTGAMIELIEMTTKSVQRIAAQLRPGMLDDLGLKEAIEWELKEFQKRTGIACDLTIAPTGLTVNYDHSTAIFRIFQEALTNITRHAEASRVEVRLEEQDGTLTFIVKDNGRGITDQEASRSESLGLLGIRERVRLLNGEVAIDCQPQGGTIIVVAIPLAKKEDE